MTDQLRNFEQVMQKGVGEGLRYNSTLCGEKKINPFVRIGQCKNSNEYMHTKKIYIYIYIYIFVYCIYLTVNYRHKERYRDL